MNGNSPTQHVTKRRRAIRGAIEGAALGVFVAVARVVIQLFRGASLDELQEHWVEVLLSGLLTIAACAFVFALGRGWTGRVAGTVLGALVGAAGGAFIGGQIRGAYAVQGDGPELTFIPLGVLITGLVGFITGAIVGTAGDAALRQHDRRSPS